MSPRDPAPTCPDTDPDPLPLAAAPEPTPLERPCPACGQQLGAHTARQSGARPRAASDTLAALVRSVPTLTESATVSQVHSLLASTTTPVVVVVDAKRRPLGVLSHQHVLACLPGRVRQLLDGVRAVDISTCGGAYLRPETARFSAVRLVREGEREYVVVTDESGAFRGVVTVYDLLAAGSEP